MAEPDPTATGARVLAARIAFAAAALLLAAVAAALLWVTFAGPFEPPPRDPAPPPRSPRAQGPRSGPEVEGRRRPPEQARPFHDAIRAGYQAGKYREEDVLGAIHALYHEYGTEEARALAKDLEEMIGMEGSP